MSDNSGHMKRILEANVEKMEVVASKARKLATEANAHAMAAEGNLHMAKHELAEYNKRCEDTVITEEVEALTAEEEAAVAAAEKREAFSAHDPTTKNGYSIALNPDANAKFETLLQEGILHLVRTFHGHKTMHIIYPAKNGTGRSVYQNKEVIKAVVPPFTWKNKMWIREAPPGW